MLTATMHLDHPRLFGYIPGPNSFGVHGNLLTAGFNIYSGTWLEVAGPSRLEFDLVAWMARRARRLLYRSFSAARTSVSCLAISSNWCVISPCRTSPIDGFSPRT